MAKFVLASEPKEQTVLGLEPSCGDQVSIMVRDRDGDNQEIGYFGDDGKLHLYRLDQCHYTKDAWTAGGGSVKTVPVKSSKEYIEVVYDD